MQIQSLSFSLSLSLSHSRSNAMQNHTEVSFPNIQSVSQTHTCNEEAKGHTEKTDNNDNNSGMLPSYS